MSAHQRRRSESAKPPASSAGVRPRGSSSSASGLPGSRRRCARARAHPRAAHHRVQQRSGVTVAEPADDQLGEPAQLLRVALFAKGEHERDPFGPETAGDEGEGLRRHAVEPLRVVDEAHQRLGLRPRPPAGRAPPAHQEAIRRLARDQPERRVRALRCGPGDDRAIREVTCTAGAVPRTASSISASTPAARADLAAPQRPPRGSAGARTCRRPVRREGSGPRCDRHGRPRSGGPASRTRCSGHAAVPRHMSTSATPTLRPARAVGNSTRCTMARSNRPREPEQARCTGCVAGAVSVRRSML